MGNCCVQTVHLDKKDLEVLSKIFLSKLTISKLFAVFNEMDIDEGGTISFNEFFVSYRIESTPLIQLILGSFNVKDLNFLEFVSLLWNFLSMAESSLSLYMFFIFNIKKTKRMPCSLLSKSYLSVHGGHGNLKNKTKLISALRVIEEKCRMTGVSGPEFAQFCEEFPIISAPMKVVQLYFQEKIIGKIQQQHHNTP